MSFRISHLQNANSVTLFFSYSYIIGRGVGGKLSFLCLSPRLARQNRKNKLFIFYCLRTLPSSVSRKSFVCHSYENCWVWGYSSRIGATHMQRPISREDSLPILKTGAKPSRPFQIVSHRAAYPSASRSTEIFSSILNEHSKQRTDNTGSYPSFLDKIQRPLQFQFELRALRQVQFVPPARLHEIRRERPQRRSFRCFLFVFVLHAPHGADSRPRCGRFCGVMLVAGSSFDQSFLCCAGFHTVVARHAHNFGDDRQSSKFCANLVEREPEFCPARHSRRFHMADMAANLRSGRQINPAARLQRLERFHFEFFIFLCALGTQFILEPHEKLGSRSNGEGFNGQPVSFAVGLLTRLV